MRRNIGRKGKERGFRVGGERRNIGRKGKESSVREGG